MKEDVFGAVVDVCESTLKQMQQSRSSEESMLVAINSLSTIIGVCAGATAALKNNTSLIQKIHDWWMYNTGLSISSERWKELEVLLKTSNIEE